HSRRLAGSEPLGLKLWCDDETEKVHELGDRLREPGRHIRSIILRTVVVSHVGGPFRSIAPAVGADPGCSNRMPTCSIGLGASFPIVPRLPPSLLSQSVIPNIRIFFLSVLSAIRRRFAAWVLLPSLASSALTISSLER